MKRIVTMILVCVMASQASTWVTPVVAAEADGYQSKQRAQEKARQLARELVSGVLDIQLRQLKENNLDKLPIYDEIRSMQKNIDKLVADEMAVVVELLVQAQIGSRDQRLAHFNTARGKIRECCPSCPANCRTGACAPPLPACSWPASR